MSEQRTAPQRLRVTGLQEAQLPTLKRIDEACAAMYHAIGFDAAEVPARSTADIAALTKEHNVHVAEADDETAGYVAWRDEPPGVAYIEELNVDPELQRFGIGSRLVEAVAEDALSHGITHAVVRCWTKARWAADFYAQAGFVPFGDAAPEEVAGWKELRAGSGRALTRPGEVLLWIELRQPARDPDPTDPDLA